MVLEEHRRQAHGRHGARDAVSMVAPCAPHRVDSDASATATMAALLSCSNSRVMSGLKLLSDDCAQSIEDGAVARLPVAGADEVEARALEHAGVVAERQLLHPLAG